MYNNIIENVREIYEDYHQHIDSDKKLVLLYWQFIDGVDMDKEVISTVDFLKTATKESIIIDAKNMLKAIENNNPWYGL